jgi:beta-xylosidase
MAPWIKISDMNKLLILLLFVPITGRSQNVECTYRNPIIGGDFPDPTVIRVGDDYYASGTTSDFAPCYPLYHSVDLINWEQIGSIFDNPPSWVKGDCWAPELFYKDGVYYAFYTAKRKTDNITCIGVATTTDITQKFEDKGILIEWGYEAIDAFVFNDEGTLYITWKAYGLDSTHPIEILCSELSSDGLHLVGEVFSLTNHQDGWIGGGDEGQCIVKRNGFYYLFYSVGGCCDTKCNYRVHVARSKNLKGKWEQYTENPILQGGELWKCPGHGTVVQTADNRDFYLYHAYHAYDFEFIGRQGLLDELLWDKKTGWPYFKYGDMPSAQAVVPFNGSVQKRRFEFDDDFQFPENEKYWLWDMTLGKPDITKKDGKMSMSTRSPFCFWGINPKTGSYKMETSVYNSSSQNLKGLCIYGNSKNMLLWGIEECSLKLYKVENDIKSEIFSHYIGASPLHIMIESVNTRTFRFHWSTDAEAWNTFPESTEIINGLYLPQWGKGVRAGLIVENKNTQKTGIFESFSIRNKY